MKAICRAPHKKALLDVPEDIVNCACAHKLTVHYCLGPVRRTRFGFAAANYSAWIASR